MQNFITLFKNAKQASQHERTLIFSNALNSDDPIITKFAILLLNPNDAKHLNNALHWACENGRLDIVNVLIENGADIESRDYLGNTSLGIAAKNGQIHIVKKLITDGANVHPSANNAPIYLSFRYKYNPDVIKELIKAGASVTAHCYYESAPISMAVSRGDIDMVKTLIKAGAEISVSNNEPIYIACNRGYFDIANELIKAGADVNFVYYRRDIQSLILLAYERGYYNIVCLLIKSNADVTVQSNYILRHAIDDNQIDIIKTILKYNSNVKIYNYMLNYAYEKNNIEVLNAIAMFSPKFIK